MSNESSIYNVKSEYSLNIMIENNGECDEELSAAKENVFHLEFGILFCPKFVCSINEANGKEEQMYTVDGDFDGSNDSLATKQQKCKNQEYKNQHQEDCEDIYRRFGNTSVNNTNSNSHSSGSSWVPMWMMMNSHSGYSYSSGNSSKSSGYVSGGSHSSSGSSGG